MSVKPDDYKQDPPKIRSASELEVLEDEDVDDFPDYFPEGASDILNHANSVNILKKREDTRGRLALIYTVATFMMFVLAFIVAILDAAWRQVSIIENLMTILPLISGIFLGSLGFVLGYYFRKAEGEEK